MIEKARISAALCDARLKDELVAARAQCPVLERAVLRRRRRHGRRLACGPALQVSAATKPADFVGCDTAVDDVALIAFTSGTTGQPKGTMHFHRDVIAMCDLFPRSVLRPGPDDVFCGTPPLAFMRLGSAGCCASRCGWADAAAREVDPESLLAAIARHRATIVFTAPTFYRQMAMHAKAHDLSSLRRSVSAGEALPDATRQLWKQATGLEMIDGIGATEMIHIFISAAPGDEARGDRQGAARLRGAHRRRCDEHAAGRRDVASRCAGRPAAATSPTSASATTCATAGT
ncbi:MAG: AMP-binding protein [Steroidobacteraceae bacterium]